MESTFADLPPVTKLIRKSRGMLSKALLWKKADLEEIGVTFKDIEAELIVPDPSDRRITELPLEEQFKVHIARRFAQEPIPLVRAEYLRKILMSGQYPMWIEQ